MSYISSSKYSIVKKKQYKNTTTIKEYKIIMNQKINPIMIVNPRLVVVKPKIFVFLVRSI
ncbi:hypothetical protein CUREO_1616 [Campylobacter ureolyticus RIGS 9880]|uniref:Uncharacterized protein n=1 Tax=Campylobacter ureolyticus RIGS 9880 TaxID=1032069 RepID=A0AAU8U1W2_9BACT|nr:hypothetical protein CUREO_1616 [Campylobacter ureolyticus RIGS 9880]